MSSSTGVSSAPLPPLGESGQRVAESSSLSFGRVAEVHDQTRGGLERGRHMAGDIAQFLVPVKFVEAATAPSKASCPG